MLLSALPDGLVRLGKHCVAIEQDSKGVKIKFQDGARAGGSADRRTQLSLFARDRAKTLFSVERRFECAAGARVKGLCRKAFT